MTQEVDGQDQHVWLEKGLGLGWSLQQLQKKKKDLSRQRRERRRQRKKRIPQSDRKDIRMKTCRRLDRAESLTLTHKDGRIFTLPPHVDSEGPGCMDGWKVLFKSKRSLSIFKALRTKRINIFKSNLILVNLILVNFIFFIYFYFMSPISGQNNQNTVSLISRCSERQLRKQ